MDANYFRKLRTKQVTDHFYVVKCQGFKKDSNIIYFHV